MIYLDNASTSIPKPRTVLDGIEDCCFSLRGSPQRHASALSKRSDDII